MRLTVNFKHFSSWIKNLYFFQSSRDFSFFNPGNTAVLSVYASELSLQSEVKNLKYEVPSLKVCNLSNQTLGSQGAHLHREYIFADLTHSN